MTLTLHITSDFICPWCWVGEHRLMQAVAGLPADIEVAWVWHPFELNPDMPAAGMDRRAYRTAKFGSWERSQQLDAQTVAAAAGDDVVFNYSKIERTPNTHAAHRLMHWAAGLNQATALANALFAGYFEQGRDIGDVPTLADIAQEIGLDRASAAEVLATNAFSREVREAVQAQQAAGVRSVPYVDADGEVISGAQPVALFRHVLQRAIDTHHVLSTAVKD